MLRHATAAMTMDLYGHPVDATLWEAAQTIGASWGHLSRPDSRPKRGWHGSERKCQVMAVC